MGVMCDAGMWTHYNHYKDGCRWMGCGRHMISHLRTHKFHKYGCGRIGDVDLAETLNYVLSFTSTDVVG